jgi:hypothetical protein
MFQNPYWSRGDSVAIDTFTGVRALEPRIADAQEIKAADKTSPVLVSQLDGWKLGSVSEFDFLEKVVDAASSGLADASGSMRDHAPPYREALGLHCPNTSKEI